MDDKAKNFFGRVVKDDTFAIVLWETLTMMAQEISYDREANKGLSHGPTTNVDEIIREYFDRALAKMSPEKPEIKLTKREIEILELGNRNFKFWLSPISSSKSDVSSLVEKGLMTYMSTDLSGYCDCYSITDAGRRWLKERIEK
jgi:hypothetical protein